jgi:hypothetical protein
MLCTCCGTDDDVKAVVRIVGDGDELKGQLVRRCRACNSEESSEQLPRQWIDVLLGEVTTTFAHSVVE